MRRRVNFTENVLCAFKPVRKRVAEKSGVPKSVDVLDEIVGYDKTRIVETNVFIMFSRD
jgi:hypothetical protein